MAISIGPLFNPTILTASAAVIYTVPSPSTSVLVNGRIRFTNTSNASQAVTLYAVPAAGSPGAGNCQMNAETLAPNAHVDVDVPLLAQGGTLQAFAGNASEVTVSAISGYLNS